MTMITGTVADGFEPVRDAFAANFERHGELGAGVAVYVDGELVVDLVGGVSDEVNGIPYSPDALQLVFSTTKGAAAVCAHLLAQRGELDLEAPVTELWPEYGAAGKEGTTVAMLLDHQAGVPVVDDPPSLEEVLAIEPIVEALAAQAPLWEPGTAHGYHALTYGWLVGEIVRRVDGRSIGRYFADEIAGPLGLEFWIGLPDEQQARVAPLVASRPSADDFDPASLDPEVLPLLQDLAAAYLDPRSTTNRALMLDGRFLLGGGRLAWNLPEVRASEIPAANGVTNARSLAKLYAACVGEVDGVRILEDETVAVATKERSAGRDRVLVVPTRFGLGFMLPSSFSPLMGERSFGHPGAGGSLGFGDPEHGVGFGYVMTKMNAGLSNDPRARGLIDALRTCF
ncbi:MAG TPA: serine hydrolase domain-containing protein [Acidimicrobiales bacterium]|nr:serine hydrolase domain-containing protein [Acidimicrobiales bacterium]